MFVALDRSRRLWLQEHSVAGTTCDRQVSPSLTFSPVLTGTGGKPRPGERCEALPQSEQRQDWVQGPGPSLQIPLVAQVRSRRCDVKTKFVMHIPCTMCSAIRRRMCPPGWLREIPEKISQDCQYGSPPPCPLPGASCGVGEGHPWQAWVVRAGTHLSTCLLAPPVGQK